MKKQQAIWSSLQVLLSWVRAQRESGLELADGLAVAIEVRASTVIAASLERLMAGCDTDTTQNLMGCHIPKWLRRVWKNGQDQCTLSSLPHRNPAVNCRDTRCASQRY